MARILKEPGMISGGIRDDETVCQGSVVTKPAVRPKLGLVGRKPMET
jgi:hypothetical protein